VESGKKDDDERLKYNIAANLIAKLTKVLVAIGFASSLYLSVVVSRRIQFRWQN